MNLAVVIVAGGRSSRMGAEKAFLEVGGRRILDRIGDVVGGAASRLAVNANGDVARFAALGLPVVGDLRRDLGTPLAGLHAALRWAAAQDCDTVLTVPSDAPFLPRDLVTRLAAADAPAAVAASGGQVHYLTGLWRASLAAALEEAIAESGLVRMQDWARHCGAVDVAWVDTPYDPFFNVNTPEELAQANRIAAEFGA